MFAEKLLFSRYDTPHNYRWVRTPNIMKTVVGRDETVPDKDR